MTRKQLNSLLPVWKPVVGASWASRGSRGGGACHRKTPVCEFAEGSLWIPEGCNNTGDASRRLWKRLGPNWQVGVLIKPGFFLRKRLISRHPGGRAGSVIRPRSQGTRPTCQARKPASSTTNLANARLFNTREGSRSLVVSH